MKKNKGLTVVITVLVAMTLLTACGNKTTMQTTDTAEAVTTQADETTETVTTQVIKTTAAVNEQTTETPVNSIQREISNEITIDGKKYALPCRLAEFMAEGWEIEGDTTYEIPEKSVLYVYLTKNGQEFQAAVTGRDGKASSIDDSLVYGVYIDNKNTQAPSWEYVDLDTLVEELKKTATEDELLEIRTSDLYEVLFDNGSEYFNYLTEGDREYIEIRLYDESHPNDANELGILEK